MDTGERDLALPLPVAAKLLDVDTRTLLFLVQEASLPLGPGPTLSIGDFQTLARHPDLVASHGIVEQSELAEHLERHEREKRGLLGRLAELEERLSSQRAEIESLRRSVVVGRAERDQLLDRLARRTAS